MTVISPFAAVSNRSSPRYIIFLELLDASLQQAEQSDRRWEEARGVLKVLKRENDAH